MEAQRDSRLRFPIERRPQYLMPATRNILALWFLFTPSSAPLPDVPSALVQSYRIVAKYPHATENYTEGFFYLDGLFYEGTGRTARSAVIVTDPDTGSVILRHELPPEYFGEGIVDWGPYLLEWTWTTHVCFVYDRATLGLVTQFQYDGEGWGMTHNSSELITSDGSATLRFRDPNTFQETRRITVKDGTREVKNLNELEFVKGEIYANVWHSDQIARISPDDGHVIAWIDLTGLVPSSQRLDSESVLNGIAYDAKNDRLFVTGKQWPAIYEIKIVPRPKSKARPKPDNQ
jgi:glutaminyl-peptide cyclotransferase